MNQQLIKTLPFLLTKIILFTSLFFICSVQAEETEASTDQVKPKQYYIVEVVLFRHMDTQGKDSEHWEKLGIENLENSSNYALAEYNLNAKQLSPLAGASVLSPEHYKLLDSANHIKYSKNYKLLAHFGWTQLSLPKSRALPIQISSNQFSDDLLPAGELTLYVSRFLHMKVNLSASECVYPPIAAPVDPQVSDEALDRQLEAGQSQLEVSDLVKSSNTECVNNNYLFSQIRKMRSKELHYIDNPAFGLLVYVTPFMTDNG